MPKGIANQVIHNRLSFLLVRPMVEFGNLLFDFCQQDVYKRQPMMACIIIAIIPIIILYMTCQKYIIEGVVAGAVKG